MSDSEDSDSFLSADEGEARADAGNESSDITLSSDSEIEEGDKAAAGGHESSDITLSSDEDDDVDKGPHSKSAGKEVADVQTMAKKASTSVKKAEVKSKPSEADVSKHDDKKTASKSEHSSDASFSLSAVTSALPSHPDSGKSAVVKCDAAVSEPLDTTVPVPTTKTSKAAAAETLTSSTETDSSVKEQLSGKEATPVSKAPVASAPKSNDVQEQHATTAVTQSDASVPDVSDGWGDFDDDIILPDDPAASEETNKTITPKGTDTATVQSVPEETTPKGTPDMAAEPQPVTAAPENQSAPQQESSPPPSEPAAPSEPVPESEAPPSERRRPERRERRGPLKLGAKKLGAKVAAPQPEQSTDDAPAPAKEGGDPRATTGVRCAETSPSAPAAAASTQQEEQDGWGGWEAWGTSLLSSAAGVTKTVLETVETGFGAPEPEDLARITREERQKRQQQQEEEQQHREQQAAQAAETPAPDGGPADSGLGLGSWFGGVSRVLGQTSSLVVNTGLDTLEAIGKKTMHVLQDDQLGIHDTITQLSGQKPSLAQALREARERRGDAVPSSSAAGDRAAAAQPVTFTHMFDQCDGTVHLEALEMLSTRCRSRVNAAKARVDEGVGVILDTIEDLCNPDELEEVEVGDFDSELSSLVARLGVPIKPTQLIIAQSSACQWLSSRPSEPAAPREVLTRAVRAAAEVGAGLAEFLHKLAELRLVEPGGDQAAAGRHLAALAALVAAQTGALAARFAETLSGQPDERAAAATTDIYLEVSYLQKFCSDSLSLMAPVLQMAALNERS
ncbi:Protein FAM114A2 [Amphibalanus amphitrite]|uniref:Protein FAM114A2 n=1 Tax=Amphibalanus amphitrite TaxID=1232801 RepID=A0A6A4VPN9_AMPAM|nr:Protein FAM114A2 [Amphibalanus amphitrite]